jgi:2-dehydro-3-deoxygalactonokinase
LTAQDLTAQDSGEFVLQNIVWIAVDWGTSNLRVWGVDSAGRVVTEASSDKGMGKLDRAGFEPALLDLVDGWLPHDRRIPIIACGMVGARQGWVEVPYRQAPCTPVFFDTTGSPETRDPRLQVIILAGIKQVEPSPDVMRGEETQIAGILLEDPKFEGVLCLPGTHTKWVRIDAGQIVHFTTFMTGELFNLFSTHSVLRHSLDGEGWNAIEFADSVRSIAADPASLSARLFSIRAGTLVSGADAATANARLSGLLIGAELAAAKTYWLDRQVTIVGNGAQSEHYAEALRTLRQSPRILDATHVTLAGLKSAYLQIAKNSE